MKSDYKKETYAGKTISFQKIWVTQPYGEEEMHVVAKWKDTPVLRSSVRGRTKKEAFSKAKHEIDQSDITGMWGERRRMAARARGVYEEEL